MSHQFQFSKIHLVLILCYATQAAIVEENFKKLEPGENITGTKIAELTVRTNMECYTR